MDNQACVTRTNPFTRIPFTYMLIKQLQQHIEIYRGINEASNKLIFGKLQPQILEIKFILKIMEKYAKNGPLRGLIDQHFHKGLAIIADLV